METSDAAAVAVTVRLVEPETRPEVAVIVVAPAESPVALPLVSAALLIVANEALDELQVADFVRSWVVLFE